MSKEIQVDAYDPADRVEVDLAYRSRAIRSTLTLDGVPVNGGLVGFKRIPGSRAGAGILQVDVQQGDTGAGLAHTELTLNADPHPPFQSLQVDEEALGEVEVRLATTDGPMVGAWIHVLGTDETLAAAALVAEDGVLRADNVPPGEVTVLWNHGGACVGADKVTVEAARTAQFKRTLPLGRLLELRCSDRSCASETLALVRVTTEAGVKVAHHLPGALPGTTFSEDGRVGLGCLTPGAYTVSLWVDEHRWGAEFELDPGPEEVPVTVTLEPTPE